MAEVILVHGLWYCGWSMSRLNNRLRAGGWQTRRFSYRSTTQAPAVSAQQLAEQIQALNDNEVCLVGHSLGGLIILQALNHLAQSHSEALQKVQRIVLLGSPLNGSAVAKRMDGFGIGRGLLGQAGCLLRHGIENAPAGLQVGMIAGTRAQGLGRLTGALDGVNDGTVALHETMHDLVSERLELPVSHTGMLFSAAVAENAARFLQTGTFESCPMAV